jgi:hypothetical protein
LKKFLKYTLVIFLALFILLGLAIQLPVVQNWGKDFAINFLEKKTGASIQLKELGFNIFGDVWLRDVKIIRPNGEEFLKLESLDTDLAISDLLRSKIYLESSEIKGLTSDIYQSSDSIWSYDFFISGFQSKDTQPTKEDNNSDSGWTFSFDEVALSSIDVKYRSELTGDSILIKLEKLEGEFGGTQIPDKFEVEDAIIHGLDLFVGIQASEKPDTTSTLPILEIDPIEIYNSSIYYTDKSSIIFKTGLDTLKVDPKTLDLNAQQYVLEDILLGQPNIEVYQINPSGATTEPSPFFLPDQIIEVKNAVFQNAKFLYSSSSQDSIQLEFNFYELNSEINSFALQSDLLEFDFTSFSASLDSSYQQAISLNGNGKLNAEKSDIPNLEARLGQSFIHLKLDGPPVFGRYLDSTLFQNQQGSLEIFDSKLIPVDLMSALGIPDTFDKALNPFKNNPAILKGGINLNNNKVGFEQFSLKQNKTLNFLFEGYINDAFSTKRMAIVNIEKLEISEQGLQAINQLSGDITDFKNSIVINGKFEGNQNLIGGDLLMVTDRNEIKLKGQLDLQKETYDAKVKIQASNYVQLIKRDGLPAKIGGDFSIKGEGFDPETANFEYAADLSEFEWKEYSYKKIKSEGSLANEKFNAELIVDDPNIQIELESEVLQIAHQPRIKLKGSIEKARLDTLNLSGKVRNISANLIADLKGDDPAKMNGTLFLTKVSLVTQDTSYFSDTISIKSTYAEGKSDINIESDIGDLEYSSTILITDLPDYILRSLNEHLPLNLETADTLQSNGYANINFKVKRVSDITALLVPGLNEVQEMNFQAKYDAGTNELRGGLNAGLLDYQGIKVHKTNLDLVITRDSFESIMEIDSVISNILDVPKFSVVASLENDTLYSEIQITRDSQKLVQINSVLYQKEDQYHLSFVPGEQIINKEKWKVNPDNYIEISKGLAYDGKVKLSKGNKSVSISGLGISDTSSHYALKFSNLDLDGFTSLLANDFEDFQGSLSGEIDAKAVFAEPIVEGKINLNSFSYQGETLGNLEAKFNKTLENKLILELFGTGNALDMEGKINYAIDTDKVKGNLVLNEIKMNPIGPFVAAYGDSIRGNLNGKVNLEGTFTNPNLDGYIRMNQLGAHVKATNTTYTIPAGEVNFKNEKLQIRELRIEDEQGNPGSISGDVTFNSLTAFNYSLKANTSNFLFLNTEKVEGLDYFGVLKSSVDLNISGNNNQTQVTGSIEVADETKFKMALPESRQFDKKEGLVKFVRRDAPKIEEELKPDDQRIGGFDNHQLEVNARIEIDENASLRIIIDPRSEDFLEVSGEGNLVFRMEKSGYMSLNGTYQVTDGAYNLSFYELIRRKFKIQKGSQLRWTGDPQNPEADITGVYEVETSPTPLLANTDNGANARRVPFEVQMQIKGKILKPEIDYSIHLSEKASTSFKSAIETRLALMNRQQNEKSKQVFALLVLGSFLTSEGSSNENVIASKAYRSVSEMLTSQLNTLSEKYIKGIDINLGLDLTESGNSNVPDAAVSLNLKKQLFNDNFTVSVGGNYGQNENPDAANLTTDIEIAYNLTDDGRFQLSVYRKGEYEGEIEGDVVKTGITLVFIKNFDEFKKIFEKNKEKKKGK